jgi:undecaprenyl-diphosphatase
MTLVESFLLGAVQGLTEFLPISSTAHLRIVPALSGWNDPGAAYTAIIQLGTLLSVFVYFRKDLASIIRGTGRDLRALNWHGADLRLAVAIVAGTLPIGVLGLLFKKQIEADLRGLPVIAGALILLAIVLALAERIGKRSRLTADLTFWQIQAIGLAQAMALIPGASRSGTTITAALLLGMRRDEAARFSFLLGIPAIAAAGVFQLKELIEVGVAPGMWSALIVGTVVSFVFGWLAIDGLLKFLKSRSTLVFIVYRIVLGVAILGLLKAGFLQN